MIFSCASDTGKVKKNNEDYILVNQEDGIFILADGIGGTSGGEVASKEASQHIHQLVLDFLSSNPFNALTSEVLHDMFYKVNGHLYSFKADNIDLHMMGTTLVLCVCREKKAVIAHIGDSRAYLIKDIIYQITKDHSVVQEMIDDGSIGVEEARNHPRKNEITKALGPVNNIEFTESEKNLLIPQVIYFELEPDDILLMCSDGLSDMLKDDEILKTIKESENIEQACNNLLKQACENGGKDNISIVIISDFK